MINLQIAIRWNDPLNLVLQPRIVNRLVPHPLVVQLVKAGIPLHHSNVNARKLGHILYLMLQNIFKFLKTLLVNIFVIKKVIEFFVDYPFDVVQLLDRDVTLVALGHQAEAI